MLGPEQIIYSGQFAESWRDSLRSFYTLKNGDKAIVTDGGTSAKPNTQIIGSLHSVSDPAPLLNTDDWNDYLIRAIDGDIQLFSNHKQIVDVTDQTTDTPGAGLLALKIYANSRVFAKFKNIKLRNIGGDSAIEAAPDKTVPSPGTADPEPIIGKWRFFNNSRRTFSPDGTSNDLTGQTAIWHRQNPGELPARYEIIYQAGKFKDN